MKLCQAGGNGAGWSSAALRDLVFAASSSAARRFSPASMIACTRGPGVHSHAAVLSESDRKRVSVCARRGEVWSFAHRQGVCALSVLRIFHVSNSNKATTPVLKEEEREEGRRGRETCGGGAGRRVGRGEGRGRERMSRNSHSPLITCTFFARNSVLCGSEAGLGPRTSRRVPFLTGCYTGVRRGCGPGPRLGAHF